MKILGFLGFLGTPVALWSPVEPYEEVRAPMWAMHAGNSLESLLLLLRTTMRPSICKIHDMLKIGLAENPQQSNNAGSR